MTHDDDDMIVMVIDGGFDDFVFKWTVSSPCLVVSVVGCVPVAGGIAGWFMQKSAKIWPGWPKER